MREPGAWRLSAGGVTVPQPPTGAERWAGIACIRSGLPENGRNLPCYAPDSNMLWEAYFERWHADQLAATNGVDPRGFHNFEGRRQWWGVSGRTLEAVLEHIKGGNSPRFEYPPPPTFSWCRGSSWMLRRMETMTSSSFDSSSHSSGAPTLSHRQGGVAGDAAAAPASSSTRPAPPPFSSGRRRMGVSSPSSRQTLNIV
ncbi:Homeobox protein KNOX3 [Hordeum vulgare]|nr:Homeobox protein KNOX3 [Hordeum vulgare]